MTLNTKLPDMSGAELIESMRREPRLLDLPIIVYNGKDLSGEEEARLRAAAEAIIDREAPSLERLLAETSLFLHVAEARRLVALAEAIAA